MEKLCTILILSSMLVVATTSASTEEVEAANRWIQAYNESCKKKPDLTLHFYVHDVLAGRNPTIWEVGRANITSKSNTSFGQVRVVDNLITSGPHPNKSNSMGRAQGMFASSDLNVTAVVFNIIFKFSDDGLYNGSSIAVLGRNQIFNEIRELIVAGGTGMFKMARGYVIVTTYNASPSNVVLEYEVNLYQSKKIVC